MEPELVGDGRRYMVGLLADTFDWAVRDEIPVWVHLDAPAGWGKTRIVHEFYRWLAAERQDEFSYWPTDPWGHDPNDPLPNFEQRRKSVVPTVSSDQLAFGAARFFWWGIECWMRDPNGCVALREDLEQLRGHRSALDQRWNEVTGPQDAEDSNGPDLGLSRWFDTRDHRDLSADPMIGAWARLGGPNENDRPRLIDETVVMLTRMGRRGLPVVIAVEDFHLADRWLCEILQGVVAAGRAVMVVTTGRPEATGDNAAMEEAVDDAQRRERFVRVGIDTIDDHRTSPEPAWPAGVFGQLDVHERRALLDDYWQAADMSTADRIAEQFANPLVLEIFTRLLRRQSEIAGHEMRLDDQVLRSVPTSVEGMYELWWAHLPDATRRTLNLATFVISALIDPDPPGGARTNTWDRHLVLEAATEFDKSGDHVAGGDAAGATKNPDPQLSMWTRSLSDKLARFAGPEQQLIASEEQAFIDDRSRSDILHWLADRVAADPDESAQTGTSERASRAHLIVALFRADHLFDDELLQRAVDELLAGLQGDPSAASACVELASLAWSHPVHDPTVMFRLATARSGAHARLGEVGVAIGFARQAIEFAEARANADATSLLAVQDLFDAQFALGDLRLRRHAFEDAEAAYRNAESLVAGTLLVDPESSWAFGHRAVVHHSLGDVARSRGAYGKAKGEYEEAISLAEGVVAASEPSVEALRDLADLHDHLADLLRVHDEGAAAVEHCEAARQARKRAIGLDGSSVGLVGDLAASHARLCTVALERWNLQDAASHLQDLEVLTTGLVESAPWSLDALRATADAQILLGDLAHKRGDFDEAAARYGQAIRTRQHVFDLSSGLARSAREMAASQLKLADLADEQGNRGEAARGYETAIAWLEGSTFRLPTLPYPTLRELSRAHARLGDLARQQGQFDRALAHLVSAWEWADFALDVAPFHSEALRDVASSHDLLGDLAIETEDFDDAAVWYDRAFAARRKLRDLAPESVRAVRDLVGSSVRLGEAALAGRNLGQAKLHFTEAKNLGRPLAELTGDSPATRLEVAMIRNNLGNLAVEQGRIDDALHHFFGGFLPLCALLLSRGPEVDCNEACHYFLERILTLGEQPVAALQPKQVDLICRFLERLRSWDEELSPNETAFLGQHRR